MFERVRNVNENTSTPKRRRLGTRRVLRSNLQVFWKQNDELQSSVSRPESPADSRDDPPLPCNQMEYLCDSGNTSDVSDIPCSPGVIESSMVKNTSKWESLVVSRDLTNFIQKATESVRELDDIEDVSDEMFYSRLEQETSRVNRNDDSLLTSRCEKHFRENIEESFNEVNQSINALNKSNEKNDDKSSLFETKDSFLLDIKETSILLGTKENKHHDINSKSKENNEIYNKDNFYGLPMVAKSLFKSLRNIENFYDWQEECLNLPAIRERRNLIYALPTSGGKTLVAEVLMLREVLCQKKNALFILPFVAIVQEKIWSLSPFAVKLDFLVEEYAAGKGHIPPKKRRKKNSIYVATIEKGLALVRSLIEENRLDEIGLIVVDELHLIGEAGRGATLEILLTTVLFANKGIQIVGMSATIGNLPQLGTFLRAEVFEREFRPVQLTEMVKLGTMLHRLQWSPEGLELVPHRQLSYDYSSLGVRADPDRLGGLVWETAPRAACLVFCPTKRNCENVAALLCKLLRKEMVSHRAAERASLAEGLSAEGASGDLQRFVRCGVAYHHAGLSSDERTLLEHAFRAGVISVLCCTSTLAAGVNLPAQRVIIRAPRVGREFLSLSTYRQMTGRAGRAGHCETGESIIICPENEWPQLRSVLSGGLAAARSVLAPHLPDLLLSGVSLRLATTRASLRALLDTTLLAADGEHSEAEWRAVCDEALRSLLRGGALEVEGGTPPAGDLVLYSHSELSVSTLGRAAIKGCMELQVAKQLLADLEAASRGLVVMGSLHLLYLAVPPSCTAGLRPDYRHLYFLYCNLDAEGVRTAGVLGITEVNAIRMATGKPVTNVPESVVKRFYLALMLHDLWKQMPFPTVADKYCVARGTVQSVMSTAAAMAASAHRFCDELEPLWPFRALFADLAPRLQHCAAPQLHQLMELPGVKRARAMQLMRAGYKRVEDIAKASPNELVGCVDHLSRSAATHLVSAARMHLIEKVENLRAEAENVMDVLNIPKCDIET